MSLALLIEQGNYVPDLRSDASAQVYVGPDHGLTDPHYVPDMLVNIPYTSSLVPTKTMQLRIDAVGSLLRMSDDLHHETGLPLVVISAYRDHHYQQMLISRFGDGNLRAKPGHSEHQLGLAIDVMGLSNAHMEGDDNASVVYQRLVTHGHMYGRHQSYQNGLSIDGYYPEKWHRRYVGVGLASALKNTNQTLTEYFYSSIRPLDPITGVPVDHKGHIFSSRVIRPRPRPATTTPVEVTPTQTVPEGIFDRPI